MNLSRVSPKSIALTLRRVPSRLGRKFSEYRFFAYLAILGPGLIAANAGNDSSGITTYATGGASYGYTLLWVFIPMTISLALVQEICIRMGVITGKGLSDLIREQFGVRWTAVIMFALLIANIGEIIAEFVGISQASELFGISRYITVPLAAIVNWWLVMRGSAKRVERVFLIMSLVFFSYIISAVIAKPDWNEAAAGFLHPTLQADTTYIFFVVALIGTTITPFMQVFIQSSVVEKGMDKNDLGLARVDAITGSIFADIIAAFVVISTAATLHVKGITTIDTASTAAESLAPIAGIYAKYLFGVGLFGASMLAMGVVPLATAYSLSEALGFEKGVGRSFREAPLFQSVFTVLTIIGALFALIPGIPQIQLLVFTQVINGLLLPIILIAIVKLSNNKEIMGDHKNGLLQNLFAWITTIVVSLLSLLLIGKTVADMF